MLGALFSQKGQLNDVQKAYFGFKTGNQNLAESALAGKSVEQVKALDKAYQAELVNRGEAIYAPNTGRRGMEGAAGHEETYIEVTELG